MHVVNLHEKRLSMIIAITWIPGNLESLSPLWIRRSGGQHQPELLCQRCESLVFIYMK